jgi:mono/diheme cytochrome c family protein
MWRLLLGVALILLVVIQAVPYGRNHANPPVRAEPSWDRDRTRTLAARVCFDCHSNQTAWPWYAHLAPISWLIESDVNEGRRAVNFSEWDRKQPEAMQSVTALRLGEMPPRRYSLRAGGLSADERQDLIRGLEATLGSERVRQKGRAVGGIAITE